MPACLRTTRDRGAPQLLEVDVRSPTSRGRRPRPLPPPPSADEGGEKPQHARAHRATGERVCASTSSARALPSAPQRTHSERWLGGPAPACPLAGHRHACRKTPRALPAPRPGADALPRSRHTSGPPLRRHRRPTISAQAAPLPAPACSSNLPPTAAFAGRPRRPRAVSFLRMRGGAPRACRPARGTTGGERRSRAASPTPQVLLVASVAPNISKVLVPEGYRAPPPGSPPREVMAAPLGRRAPLLRAVLLGRHLHLLQLGPLTPPRGVAAPGTRRLMAGATMSEPRRPTRPRRAPRLPAAASPPRARGRPTRSLLGIRLLRRRARARSSASSFSAAVRCARTSASSSSAAVRCARTSASSYSAAMRWSSSVHSHARVRSHLEVLERSLRRVGVLEHRPRHVGPPVRLLRHVVVHGRRLREVRGSSSAFSELRGAVGCCGCCCGC